MAITAMTWIVALGGVLIMGVLGSLQLVAVLRPQSDWVVKNVYGGSPDDTDRTAYFAYHQGWAWADVLIVVPLQLAGSIGMLLGTRWGFLFGLLASVPFCYSAIPLFIWDRDLHLRKPTAFYWLIVWGMFPAFGLLEGSYCFWRLLTVM